MQLHHASSLTLKNKPHFGNKELAPVSSSMSENHKNGVEVSEDSPADIPHEEHTSEHLNNNNN